MNKSTMPKTIVVAPQKLKKNLTSNSLYSIPENYDEIKNNIREFGLLSPLLVTSDYEIISGNIRHQIALDLELKEVPIIILDIPEEKKDILAISSNQFRKKTLVEIAAEIRFFENYYSIKKGQRTDLYPQMKLVKQEKDAAIKSVGLYTVNKIKSIEKKVVGLYGDDVEKLNDMLSKVDKNEISLNQLEKSLETKLLKQKNNDIIPETYELITENAQIFNKSCNDMSELNDNSIQTIITSPPYFKMRDYGTGKSQLGLEKQVEKYVDNLVNLFDDAKRVLREEGSLFVNINDCVIDGEYQSVPELFLIGMKKKGWKYIDQYLWLKPNSQYINSKRSIRNYEPIFHFVKNVNKYYYNDYWLSQFIDDNNKISMGTLNKLPKLVAGLDYRDGIIKHTISNTIELRKKCIEKGFLMEHSATFPITLPLIFTLATSKPGDLILDMFSGTATTGEASLLTGRKYIGYETNPQFIVASEVRLSEHLIDNAA